MKRINKTTRGNLGAPRASHLGICDDVIDDTWGKEDGQEASEEAQFVCRECSSTFTWKEDLRSHMILIHSESCWRCPKISEVMISPAEFSEHFNSHHTPTQLKVSSVITDKPEKSAGCVSEYQASLTLVASVVTKSLQRSQLSQHVKVQHPTSFWPCKHCDLLKYSDRSLRFQL